jgi:hypothetical protein
MAFPATVSRLDVAVGAKALTLLKKTTIAAGYTHVPNAGAVVLGPTGLAFDRETDSLYVASTADNKIYVAFRCIGWRNASPKPLF